MTSETLVQQQGGALPEVSSAETYYTVTEAAELLRVSRITVWRWIRAGYLPVARLGHRTTRIRGEDLQRLPVQLSAAIQRRSHGGRMGPSIALPAAADADYASASEHFVQFYDNDAYLVEAVATFIGAALQAGGAGIVVATPQHREQIEAALQGDRFDLAALASSGHYVALDAAATLDTFMRDGSPDGQRFETVIGDILTTAARHGQQVRVYGEMVSLLAAAGNPAATIRLEQLWNELLRTRAFSLLCGYAMDQFGGEAMAELLSGVCAEHSRVEPTESYTVLLDDAARLRAVAVLQQQARSLQAEIVVRRQAEERLRVALEAEQQAREQAEVALHVRDEFLSMASHELRTPISSLSAQAQLLLRRLKREGTLEPDRVERAMQLITSQTDKIARLVGQLLDVTRLDAGKLTVEREPTPVVPLVERMVQQAQDLTDRHLIDPQLEVAGSLEACLDPLRLEQVLTNLLDNAVKYSPEGGTIEVVVVQPTKTCFEIAVRDHGLGVPVERRDQIFDRFYQAHDGAQRGGMGLGLYISRQIVELHSGEIRAEFPPDGGTRMVVRLPLEPSAAQAESGAALASST